MVTSAPWSADGVWQLVDDPPEANVAAVREPWVQPQKFQGLLLNPDRLAQKLSLAPREFTEAAVAQPLEFLVPMPDGTFSRFALVESPVMAPELAARFPQIKTYLGQGIDEPAATLRCDWTPQGFHAQVLSPNGAVYVDPYWRDDRTFYASYYKRDAGNRQPFSCLTGADLDPQPPLPSNVAFAAASTLRTYRLACAATGEYTAFHGGTVTAGLAAVVTAVNRVTGLYETELAIRLQLVANNNLLIYTNAGTDPYTNNDGFAMLGQNQSNINSVIGSANYDIGHVFSTGGGGVAGLRVVCVSSSKARGVTGLPSPTGDEFYIDYVAHEMGHQFGANHSFNGTGGNCSGNRNGSTAYEPGSGSTIMGYAGICGLDNLQSRSDPFFHSVSLDEITNYVTSGSGSTCGQQTPSGNSTPTVNAGLNFVIPARTPFVLTAFGQDADGDPLTYSWEQRDLGPASTLIAPDDGVKPIFRFWPATSDATRTFPRLSNLLNNTLPTGEKLPVENRTMDFRVVVRDNRAGGGATASDNMVATVVKGAGPFKVTRPNTNMEFAGLQEITWDVAATNLSPINTANVSITFSTNDGLTFTRILAPSTPNDGSEFVQMPNVWTTAGRIKVQGAGNIFFDLSDANFTMQSCAAASAPLPEPVPRRKNRFLSFDPGNDGTNVALRVTYVNTPAGFGSLVGQSRWVGPPHEVIDTDDPLTTFFAAELQCTPHFQEWTGLGVIHVYGAGVIPAVSYDVQAVGCEEAPENLYSAPLSVATAIWGDVADPMQPPAKSGQPDVLDAAAAVDRLKEVPSPPSKVFIQVQPNALDPDGKISILDVSAIVDALKGLAYPFPGPGPCP